MPEVKKNDIPKFQPDKKSFMNFFKKKKKKVFLINENYPLYFVLSRDY